MDRPVIADALITSEQLAELVQISPQILRKMAKAKKIPGIKINSKWRFRWNDVLASLTQETV